MKKITEFVEEFSWLSNFTPVKIMFDGDEYPSVEHAYMSAKSHDEGWKEFCQNTKNPGSVKRASRKIKLREGWDDIKFDIMLRCLEKKFIQEPFKSKLIETGDAYIMEGNWWKDTYWGIDLKSGEGNNYLGKLIMGIRTDLINRNYDNFLKY